MYDIRFFVRFRSDSLKPMDHEHEYWLAFSIFPGIGPVRFRLLREYFGSAQAAWKAPADMLKTVGLPDRVLREFLHFRSTCSIPDCIRQLRALNVGILTSDDDRYPPHLKKISDAPFVLYVLGKKSESAWDVSRSVAVVGTRKVTDYGRSVTKQLVGDLVAQGFTIVSGMAMGVDAVAHQTAMDLGGRTIAVLGCGVNVIAPAWNTDLYHRIITGGQGAVMSEMPLSHRPGKGLFPARNRIISGLSLGVVVIEGSRTSGALITARYAAEQGREVMAVPGPVTSVYSDGPALLLKQGATLVRNGEDVLEAFGLTPRPDRTRVGVSPQTPIARDILRVLGDGQYSVDDLVTRTSQSAEEILATLTLLELQGFVVQTGPHLYNLTR